MNEAETRKHLIDRQLAAAGWNLNDPTQVGREIPAGSPQPGPRPTSREPRAGYDSSEFAGITDDCLYDEDATSLAVNECKRTSRNPRDGEAQLRGYVNRIAATQSYPPFGFMANGHETWFWEVGEAHPRMVAGFFSRADLKRLRFIRENRIPLTDIAINRSIVDRDYQHEAIRRVAEAFTQGKRRALLVMATGTGKTRTAMGLVDIFLQSHWAQKILFVADRDELVKQALSDGFKTHLPNEPRVRIHSAAIDKEKRLYVATLQTMSMCYEKFTPGFFDLIIFDEAHRSIFNRFNEVMEYFDARMVGLTATPAAFIDRDTFDTFHCQNQTPTFLYTYKEAVDEGHLVDFRLYQAQTGFQRNGIKGANLSEENKNTLIAQGIDPDTIDFAGTDLEDTVSNRDTIRRQWEEIMEKSIKDRAGSLLGKTIIFAVTKKHAERIRAVFEEMFPEHVGLLQLIYSGMERVHEGPYGDGLIDKFKKLDKPRIAVSVDMLDTGVDVPEVVNLVFMKPVHSRIKLWQMIGRGTRNDAACRYQDRLPEGKKTEFLIIDFWQNDFGKQTDEVQPAALPLFVRLFHTRLDILTATLSQPSGVAHTQTIADCRAMLNRIPIASFLVRKIWPNIRDAWTDQFWTILTGDRFNYLRTTIAPVLRFVPDIDLAAETFANKVERLNLQILTGQPAPQLLTSIAEDVSLLPAHVQSASRCGDSIRLALSNDLARATPPQLKKLIQDLAGEMKNKRRLNSFLELDLPDFITDSNYIVIGPTGQPIHVTEYRRRIEQRITSLIENHPALVAIREGREPSPDTLVDLERVLHTALSATDINLSQKTARQAYGVSMDNRTGFLGFVRHVLDVDAIPDYETVVATEFQNHITGHNYSADQIRFLRAVQDVFLAKRHLTEADLYEAPLTSFGRNAVERYFTQKEIKEIVALTDHVAA